VTPFRCELRTRGKGRLGRNNLIVLNTTARNVGNPFSPEVDLDKQESLIPYQAVRLGSLGYLGNDGKLYKALPDGATRDCTVVCAGRPYYNYDIPGTQKHKLKLRANDDVDLDSDVVVSGAEFCVGQEVTLQATWTPELHDGVQDRYFWIMSLDYVNSSSLAGAGASQNYIVDEALRTQNPTSLWWYSDGTKHVWCVTTNTFSNGQQVVLSAVGNLLVYRPKLVDFKYGPPTYTTLPYATNYVDQGTPYLSLGDGNAHGDMQFRVDILSKYPGRADYTQLISRWADDGGQMYPFSTGALPYLDNFRFYLAGSDDPNQTRIVHANRVEPILGFSDSPGWQRRWGIYGLTTAITDSFETYVMFRPDEGDPSSNIFVCLGKLTWSWSASTTFSAVSGWSTPTFTLGSPELGPDDSCQFPTWSNTYQP
jgi:hypothetical protein